MTHDQPSDDLDTSIKLLHIPYSIAERTRRYIQSIGPRPIERSYSPDTRIWPAFSIKGPNPHLLSAGRDLYVIPHQRLGGTSTQREGRAKSYFYQKFGVRPVMSTPSVAHSVGFDSAGIELYPGTIAERVRETYTFYRLRKKLSALPIRVPRSLRPSL